MNYNREEDIDWLPGALQECQVVHYTSGDCVVSLPAQTERDMEAQKTKQPQSSTWWLRHPVELLECLVSLPRHDLVSRIVISGAPADEQELWRDTFGSTFEIASRCENGTIIFYGEDLQFRREQVLHEWAHAAVSAARLEFFLFSLASVIERDWFACQLARFDDAEDFACHLGEYFMNQDMDFFFTLAVKAPVKTAVLGKALARILGEQAVNFPDLNERIAAAQKVAMPEATKRLLQMVQRNHVDAPEAAMLFALLAPEEELSKLAISSLVFTDAPLDDACLGRIGKLTTLVELDLAGTDVTDDGIKSLRRLPALRRLDLSRTRVSNAALAHLRKLSLRDLSLHGSDVNDLCVYHLGVLETLENLSLPFSLLPETVERLGVLLANCRIMTR